MIFFRPCCLTLAQFWISRQARNNKTRGPCSKTKTSKKKMETQDEEATSKTDEKSEDESVPSIDWKSKFHQDAKASLICQHSSSFGPAYDESSGIPYTKVSKSSIFRTWHNSRRCTFRVASSLRMASASWPTPPTTISGSLNSCPTSSPSHGNPAWRWRKENWFMTLHGIQRWIRPLRTRVALPPRPNTVQFTSTMLLMATSEPLTGEADDHKPRNVKIESSFADALTTWTKWSRPDASTLTPSAPSSMPASRTRSGSLTWRSRVKSAWSHENSGPKRKEVNPESFPVLLWGLETNHDRKICSFHSCKFQTNPYLHNIYAVGTYSKSVGVYVEPDGQVKGWQVW